MPADEVQNVASKKVEAPVKKPTVAKAKKSTGAKKGTKAEAKKMSYLEMVTDAITTMKDRSGSSRKVNNWLFRCLFNYLICSGHHAPYPRDAQD